MTRDELISALTVERFAPVTPPPPARAGGAVPDDDRLPDPWAHWADEPDDDPAADR